MEIVLEDLAAQVGISAAIGPAVVGTVTVAFEGVPAERAIRTVCDQVGAVPILEDGVLRFVERGAYEAEEVALVVPGYEDVIGAASLLRDALGEDAKVREIGSRVVVVGPRGAVSKAAEISSRLREGPDGWMITTKIVQVQESWLERMGVGIRASGGVEANLFAGAGNVQGLTPVAGASVSGILSALAEASAEGSEARLLNVGSLYILEGQKASVRNGEVVPVPRRVVSPEGTVTTHGYDFIPTGFELEVTGRRVPDGLLVEILAKLSVITGFVESAPITAERSMNGVVIVESGDTVVLTGLDALADRVASERNPLPFLGAAERDSWTSDRTQVWIIMDATRVYASGRQDEHN